MGGTDEIEVDVRLIAATNRPLEDLVRERRFREDLFYRLNVIPLRIPPLRERREDIPLLAEHFLKRFTSEMGKAVTSLSPEAQRLLGAYPWPGNVRELENVIERVVALETTPQVLPGRLPESIASRTPQSGGPVLGDGFSLDGHLRDVEAALLHAALREARGDRTAASRLLGVSARSLRYLIGKHGEGPAA